MKINSLLLLFSSLVILQCKPNLTLSPQNKEPELPEVTQEGKDTFGCLVNGKVWLPKVIAIAPSLQTQYVVDKGELLIYSAIKYQGTNQSIAMRIDSSLFQVGTYSFANNPIVHASFSDLNKDCYYNQAKYPDFTIVQNGSLEITKLDKEKRIVAGRFQFTLTAPGCDTIHVTDGRFDLQMNLY